MHRRNLWLLGSLVLVGVATAAWGASALAALPAQSGPTSKPPAVQVRHPDVVARAVKSDTSPPLRDIPPLRYGMYKFDDNDNPKIQRAASPPSAVDSVIQRALGPL